MAKKKVNKKRNKKAHKKPAKRAVRKNKSKRTERPACKRTGRPPVFKEEFVALARGLSRQGMNDKQIAGIYDVTPKTISIWRAKHSKFDEAIIAGRGYWDAGKGERTLIQLSEPHDEVRVVEELRGRGRNRKMEVVKRYTDKNKVDTNALKTVLVATNPRKYGPKIQVDIPKPVKVTSPELIKACKDAAKAFANSMRDKG